MPISHGEGRYHCDPADEQNLAINKQILLRYSAEDGSLDAASNPNGSVGAIAGIRNREGTVFGLMPHPERCCDQLLGGIDGRVIFKSMIEAMHA
jgi:phosphoribosylformylglycinamidine synthase